MLDSTVNYGLCDGHEKVRAIIAKFKTSAEITTVVVIFEDANEFVDVVDKNVQAFHHVFKLLVLVVHGLDDLGY